MLTTEGRAKVEEVVRAKCNGAAAAALTNDGAEFAHASALIGGACSLAMGLGVPMQDINRWMLEERAAMTVRGVQRQQRQ